MGPETMPLLQVKNLRVAFRQDRHTVFEAVRHVSFDVPRNQTVALVGESGSGKSVSSLAVMGLLPETAVVNPDAAILFEGQNLLALSGRERRKLCGSRISMIFQDPMSSLNPVFTVGSQIDEVLRLHRGMDAAQARERAVALLGEVGFADPASRVDAYPHQLSGGQQQRVMIAMAIACEPQLLIADEPTTALDMTIQKQIVDLLKALQRSRQMSVLFITHDLQLVAEVADAVMVMRHGEIQEAGKAAQVLAHPSHPYTAALLACRPPLDARPQRLPVIEEMLGGAAIMAQPERKRGYGSGDSPLLEVRHLQKCFFSKRGLFGRSEFCAVKDVSFVLPRGKTLGVVGESGSGKTTMGLTLLRLHEPTGGEAFFDGKDLFAMTPKAFMAYKRRLQVVFQNPFASLNPRFTVGQILMEPMQIHGVGVNREERMEMAFRWLARVGLPESAFYRYPHAFSGGQRQRIAIARCLVLSPEVLVCDESVSALDVSVQAQVLNLLQDLQDELGISYLFISHDLAVVKYMADQVMVMRQGEVVEMADADEIYRQPRHPYTRMLLDAIPKGRHFS
ncbi:MAG: ABC transporter ATP-binding protein [Oxalobacter formigenes]|nr:ABC transporter ATP-binding protein [Oxalobacter formigenes]